jgi:hypothetical protein
MSRSKYTHRVIRKGGLCSEHGSRALADKAVARLVAMSRGKLTATDFQIEEIR